MRPTAFARRVLAAAAATAMLVHLPVLFLGGLAVLMRADLPAFDAARLGLAVSSFFAVSAIASVLGGRLAEARGPRVGMVAAGVGAAISLVGIASATSATAVVLAAMVGGIANGMGQPAASLAVARGVQVTKQGLAFGVNHSAVPFAGLLAGLASPIVGLAFGWRWAFVLAAVLALGLLSLVPRWPVATVLHQDLGRGKWTASRAALYLMVLGAAAGAAASNALGSFIVSSAVAYGWAPGPAGYLLAFGSLTAIASRILTGWIADRRGSQHLRLVALMLTAGAAGYVVLAMGAGSAIVLCLGTALGFAAGWGWPGLMMLTVVRLDPHGAGTASGMLLSGITGGCVLGPPLFGVLARESGFPLAWTVMAALATLAAALVMLARSVARRDSS